MKRKLWQSFCLRFYFGQQKVIKAWFGFKISVYMTAVIAAVLCLMPRVGLLTWSEAKIKMDLMLFAAGAYAAGNTLESTKSAQWIMDKVVHGLGLEKQ